MISSTYLRIHVHAAEMDFLRGRSWYREAEEAVKTLLIFVIDLIITAIFHIAQTGRHMPLIHMQPPIN